MREDRIIINSPGDYIRALKEYLEDVNKYGEWINLDRFIKNYYQPLFDYQLKETPNLQFVRESIPDSNRQLNKNYKQVNKKLIKRTPYVKTTGSNSTSNFTNKAKKLGLQTIVKILEPFMNTELTPDGYGWRKINR